MAVDDVLPIQRDDRAAVGDVSSSKDDSGAGFGWVEAHFNRFSRVKADADAARG